MYPEWEHELLDAKSLRRAMSVGGLRFEVGSSVVKEPGSFPNLSLHIQVLNLKILMGSEIFLTLAVKMLRT